MNLIKKIFISVFITWISLNAFAANDITTTLKTDQEKYDINQNITLDISVEWEVSWKVNFWEVKGIENFDVLTRQTTSSFTSVNWNSSLKTCYIYILQAKKDWKFDLWPVSIEIWNKKLTTNQVSIEVSWTKSQNSTNWNISNNQIPNQITMPWFSININPWINQWINNVWVPWVVDSSWNDTQYVQEFDPSLNKDKWFFSKYFVEILIFALLALSGLVYYLLTYKEENNTNQIIQEIENINSEVVYPELNDEEFCDKVDNIFKNKLIEKYDLDINILTKDYWYISNLLSDLPKQDFENITEIIDNIQKAKYSNLVFDKTNLLDLVKEF